MAASKSVLPRWKVQVTISGYLPGFVGANHEDTSRRRETEKGRSQPMANEYGIANFATRREARILNVTRADWPKPPDAGKLVPLGSNSVTLIMWINVFQNLPALIASSDLWPREVFTIGNTCTWWCLKAVSVHRKTAGLQSLWNFNVRKMWGKSEEKWGIFRMCGIDVRKRAFAEIPLIGKMWGIFRLIFQLGRVCRKMWGKSL